MQCKTRVLQCPVSDASLHLDHRGWPPSKYNQEAICTLLCRSFQLVTSLSELLSHGQDGELEVEFCRCAVCLCPVDHNGYSA